MPRGSGGCGQVHGLPLAYREWAEAQGYPQPPTETCGIHNEGTRVSITAPYDGQTMGGLVEIQGSAVISEYSHYILEYGISHDPGGWGLVRDATSVRVESGTLGFWDTRALGNGPHTVRILAFNARGQAVERRVRVYVLNEGAAASPSPLTTSTPTGVPDGWVTPTITPYVWPTVTLTATPSQTPSPTVTPTSVASPTPTWTPEPTATHTLVPSPTHTATLEPGPTLIVLPTLEPTATPEAGPTLIVLPTPSPTSEGGAAPAPTRAP